MLPGFTLGSLQAYAAVALPQVLLSVIIIIIIIINITIVIIITIKAERKPHSVCALFTNIFRYLISADEPKFNWDSH